MKTVSTALAAIVCLGLGIALFAAAPSPAAAANAPTASAPAATTDEWFKLSSEAASHWSGTAEANRMVARRRDGGTVGPRVMVLYSRPSSAYEAAMSKLLSIFHDKGIDAVFEAINFQDNAEQGRAALHYAQSNSVDLIFAMGSESTEFLVKNFRGQRIPVVSVCAKDPVILGQIKDYTGGSGTNFAFTSLNVPVETQLAYLLQLRPNLKAVGILVDSKNLSAMHTQAEPFAAAVRRRGLFAAIIAVNGPDDARRELREKIPAAIAAMRRSDPTLTETILLITGSTSVFAEIDTVNAAAGQIPVVSVVPEIVRKGSSSATLSIGISFESNAHLAAIYGADILRGLAKAGSLNVGVVSPPDIAINFLKARQIGLKIPFPLFETASQVYDGEGNQVRINGINVE
jgi:putative ABC transport system substrate-binding protein